MRNKLLTLLFLIACISGNASDDYLVSNRLDTINDTTFSFKLESTTAQQSITIISDVREPMLIKVIDDSGFIRIQKKLHVDREVDISGLLEGTYVIRIYVGNHTAVKRFYKGQDGVDIK
ncbi:T9SS type A sorting domain-containing protein [uncultured Aquimarina sp.]|uniref:T9SS type A sorting domain-containing protein n=1 Tax=Aquimarina sp. LLG6339-5 TaxID=3160830 RepID=UPI0026387725|nr:T9SS type A sorting domain-containing protein [uncultured Aquimarina sp.]